MDPAQKDEPHMKTITLPRDLSSVGLAHPQTEQIIGDRLHRLPADLDVELAAGRLWLVSDMRADLADLPPHWLVVADAAPVVADAEVALVVALA